MSKENLVRVGWLSDTHVGYRQYGMLRRQADFVQAYLDTLRAMVEAGVDCIIHTGDLINSAKPSDEDMLVIREGEELLQAKRMKMFLIAGQHDGLTSNWTRVVTKHNEYGYQPLQDGVPVVVRGLTLVGFSHQSKERLLSAFKQPDCEGHILMLHQAVQELVGFPAPSALALAELPTDRFQVVALGDIHIHELKVKKTPDNPVAGIVGYPGSTELNSATEPDDKYWVELRFVNGRLNNAIKHRIQTRPVVRLDLKTEADITGALEIIAAGAVQRNAEQHELRAPIVFVKYLNTLPKVQERLFGAFNPDEFVFQFDPVFVSRKPDGTVQTEGVPENLTVEDVRRSMVPADSRIYQVSAQLLAQEADAGAILDAFIAQRLAAPAAVESGSGDRAPAHL